MDAGPGSIAPPNYFRILQKHRRDRRSLPVSPLHKRFQPYLGCWCPGSGKANERGAPMLHRWLRRLHQWAGGTKRPGLTYVRKLARLPLLLEPLEDRVVPATKTWALTIGGNWGTPSNWSGGTVPVT